eukprot:TRINITY_DN44082_c0_g1_i1.p1 TRINITY_DN44082_c0_g1~~TRINITY_DN44082_c0_g1_i1.p1  ORF type:complete len:383 (+),score=49.87 TRINITY_DN44082_c0_g1_i1:39-1187(+)
MAAPWDGAVRAVRNACASIDRSKLCDLGRERLGYLERFVLRDHECWVKNCAECGAPDDLGPWEMHVVDFHSAAEVVEWIRLGWSAGFWCERDARGRAGGSHVPREFDDSDSDSAHAELFGAPGAELQGKREVDFQKILARQQQFFDEEKEQEAQRSKDPLGIGRWVTLHGMQTASMNGCVGEIIAKESTAGRMGVRVQGRGDSGKLIKTINLNPFSDADVVKIARIGAQGEKAGGDNPGGIRTWHWPRSVLGSLESETSPVSQLIGLPLQVAKVQAHEQLQGRADFDNQWATFLMIEPKSGLAPDKWQSYVGPVVVWRPCFQPFSSDDMCLVYNYFSKLLDRYPGVRPSRDITRESFESSKRQDIEMARLNPHMEQYDDLNI